MRDEPDGRIKSVAELRAERDEAERALRENEDRTLSVLVKIGRLLFGPDFDEDVEEVAR